MQNCHHLQKWKQTHRCDNYYILSQSCARDHNDDWRKRPGTEERFWACRTSTSTRWALCRWSWPLWSSWSSCSGYPKQLNKMGTLKVALISLQGSAFFMSFSFFLLSSGSPSLQCPFFTKSHQHNEIGDHKLTSGSPFAPCSGITIASWRDWATSNHCRTPRRTSTWRWGPRMRNVPAHSETIGNVYRFIKEGKQIWWPTKRIRGWW